MSYNYMEALKEDIREYLSENYEEKTLYEKLKDNQAEFEEELHDELWVTDSVTGNASGSYTFNTYTAKQYVFENLDLLKEAFDEFEVEASAFFEKGAEYCDVTIRCYLLRRAISETLLDIMVENCITKKDIEPKRKSYEVETQSGKFYEWTFEEGKPKENDYGNGIYIGVTSPSGEIFAIDCRYIQKYIFENVCTEYLKNYYGNNLKGIWE